MHAVPSFADEGIPGVVARHRDSLERFHELNGAMTLAQDMAIVAVANDICR